jgi:hypothetical protein
VAALVGEPRQGGSFSGNLEGYGKGSGDRYHSPLRAPLGNMQGARLPGTWEGYTDGHPSPQGPL